MKSGLLKKILVISSLLATLVPAFADEFKNSVVNMKFTKDSAGNLRVNVVTAKPYSSPVYVNKKEDNRYVILLPETDNSMLGKPIIDNVNSVVSGVSIKTQPYVAGGCKGYTKITITALEPVRVCAYSSVQVSTAPIQSVKPVQTANKPKQTAANSNLAQKVEKQDKFSSQNAKTNISTQPQVAKTVPTVKKDVIPVEKPRISDKTVQSSNKPSTVKIAVKPIPVENSQNTKAKNMLPKTNTNVTLKTSEGNIADVMPQPEIFIKEQKQMVEELKNEFKTKVKSVSLSDIKNNVDWLRIIMILSAIGFPLLALLCILSLNKKMKKRIQQINEINENSPVVSSQEEGEITKSVEHIDSEEDMVLSDTQGESFATVVKEIDEEKDSIEDLPLEDNIDELVETYDIVNNEDLAQSDYIDGEILESKQEVEMTVMLDSTQNNIDEIQEDVLSENRETEMPEETVVEPDESDAEEDNVTVPDVDKFESIEENDEALDVGLSTVSEVEQNDVNPDEENNLPDIDDECINDDIEVEEISLTEVQPAATEEEVADIIEDEIIDKDLEGDSTEFIEIEDINKTDEVVKESEAMEIAKAEEYAPDGFINDFESNINDDSIFDELRAESLDFSESNDVEVDGIDDAEQNDDVFDELREEYVTVDGLTVLSKADISETSGLYLVNFENFTSLIGYINEEIFVLKTFDEFVNNEIYTKIAEQLSDKVFRYIVKIGLYKMVIEVSDKKMSHLIDL